LVAGVDEVELAVLAALPPQAASTPTQVRLKAPVVSVNSERRLSRCDPD